MASTSIYTLTPSQQLMQNHIPAAVLDAANGLAALETAAGANIVVAIGSDAVLRANIETQGSTAGWETSDLSTAIPVPSGMTGGIKSFAASLNSESGVFYLLAVLSLTGGGQAYDQLQLLTGPNGVDPSVWLGDAGLQQWTTLAYDGVSPIGTVDAATLVIDDIMVEMGGGTEMPSLALAVAATGITGSDAVFALNLSGTGTVWQFFPQEQPVDGQGIMMAPGNLRTAAWGIYKLYGPAGEQSLTFEAVVTNEQEVSALIYALPLAGGVPITGTAIASLIYTPSPLPPFRPSPPPYSDVFLAGDGAIYRYPYNDMAEATGIQILSTYAQGVSQIHALNAGSVAFLWWVNGAGQLVYSSAPIDDLASWAAPVVLLGGVSAAASIMGSSPLSCGACAVAQLPAGSNVGPSATTSGPIMIARNPTTAHWTSTILPTPTTTDAITLQTYTTRILVQEQNTALTLQSLPVTPTIDCTLIINGGWMPVQANMSVTLATDNAGYLTLIYPASGLAGLSFDITLPDGTTQTVEAEANVVATLQGVTPGTLTTANCQNNDGSTYALISGNGKGTATDTAPIVSKLASYSTGLARACRLSDEVRAARVQPRVVRASGVGDDPIEMAIGDLVQFASNVVSDVEAIAWDGVNLTITIAGAEFNAVVQCVEDALQAITAVLAWIGAAFEDVFRWLAFIFSWSDIKAVYEQFQAILEAPFTALTTPTANGSTVGADLFTAVYNYIEYIKGVVDPTSGNAALAQVGSGSPSSAVNAQPAPPNPGSNGTNLQNDSRLGWVNDRLSTPPSSSPSAVRTTAPHDSDAYQNFLNQGGDFGSALQAFGKTVATDIDQFFGNGGNAGQFLISLIQGLAGLGLDVCADTVQAASAAIPDIVAAVNTTLEGEYEIPVISALFADMTGDPLNMTNIAALASAFVFTIGYKIVEDSSPVTPLTNANFAQVVTTAITGLQADIEALTNPTGTRPIRTRTPRAVVGDGDLPMGAEDATGWLLIGQSITAAVMGIAEMKEYEGFAALAYWIDLALRIARGSIEVANDDNSWAAADMVQVELCFNIGMVFCNLLLDGEMFRLADALWSPIWGTWEIGAACGSGIDGGQIMEAGIEFLEPVVALSAPLSEDNIDMTALAGTAIGMRVLCAIGAGAIRLAAADGAVAPRRQRGIPAAA